MRSVALMAVALAALSGCIQINVGPPEAPADPHSAHDSPTTAPAPPFSVEFASTPDVPMAGRQTTFQATVEGLGDRSFSMIHWDFGDGESRTCQEEDLSSCFRVNHVYDEAGDYEAALNVLLDDGVSAQRLHGLIVVNPPSP